MAKHRPYFSQYDLKELNEDLTPLITQYEYGELTQGEAADLFQKLITTRTCPLHLLETAHNLIASGDCKRC